MKTSLIRSLSLALTVLSCGSFAHATGSVVTTSFTYPTPNKDLEGNQPVVASYVDSVASPTNLASLISSLLGGPVPVTLQVTVLSAPAGISANTALGFISLSSLSGSPALVNANGIVTGLNTSGVSVPALQYTGAQFTLLTSTLNFNVTVNVPLGNYAGSYAYQIIAIGSVFGNIIQNGGSTVNANISPPLPSPVTPTVVLNTPANLANYTLSSAGTVSFPVNFNANVVSGGAPITGLVATVVGPNGTVTGTATYNNGTITTTGGLTITAGAMDTSNVTGNLSFTTSVAGPYTVTVTGTNSTGSNTASADVTVGGLPPTITVVNPLTTSYTYTIGGAAVSVPVSFTGISPTGSGNITAVTATLGGVPLTLTAPTVGSAVSVTATAANLSLTSAGAYTLVYTASNLYGTATQSVIVNVATVVPNPTVTVATSAATYQIATGATSVSVPYTVSGATTYQNVVSFSAALSQTGVTGSAVVTPSTLSPALPTVSFTGSGTLSITAPGTYTLTDTDANTAGGSAKATTTFTVTAATPPPPAEAVTWLPPVSLGQAFCGGSCIPVNFSVTQNGTAATDTSLIVAIFQIYSNGTSSTPVLYTYNSSSCWSSCNSGWWATNGSCSNASNNYGCGNWNSCGWNACTTYYSIANGAYSLCFPSDTGVNTYKIEVYKQTGSSASSIQILNTITVTTAACGNCYDNNGNTCQGQDDNHGDCIVSNNCWGNYSSGRNSFGASGCHGYQNDAGRTNNDGYCGSANNCSKDNNSCNSNNSWGGGW